MLMELKTTSLDMAETLNAIRTAILSKLTSPVDPIQTPRGVGGRRHGSEVKTRAALAEKIRPVPIPGSTTVCDSSFRGLSALLWPLQLLHQHAYGDYTYMKSLTHRHYKKQLKTKGKNFHPKIVQLVMNAHGDTRVLEQPKQR